MFKTICLICNKEFEKENQQSADQALRMHNNRTHNKTVNAPNDLPSEKRKYTKRKGLEQNELVNFCPKCGCNLQTIRVAINL